MDICFFIYGISELKLDSIIIFAQKYLHATVDFDIRCDKKIPPSISALKNQGAFECIAAGAKLP